MSNTHHPDLPVNCEGCELRGEGWFCDLSQNALRTLDGLRCTTNYPKGATLFDEGQTPRGVYILCRGSVKLSTSSSNARVLITKIAEPGEVLGLSAFMTGHPYEVTAETLSPSLVTFIKREQFTQLLAEHEGTCRRVAQQLNRDYHAAHEKARLLGLSASTTGKLARLLLQLAERGGTQTERGIRMKVALTHEELGQLIGASRETVTRLLGDLKSREILQTKGATMLLRDRDALEALLAA